MKNLLIYTLSDPRNNEIRYIGLTTESLSYRLSKHCNKPRNNHNGFWIKSLLKKNLKPIIEKLDEAKTFKELCELEMYWISQFKCWGFNLTNQTNGGEGSYGYKHSDETKKKISEMNYKRFEGKKKPKPNRLTKKEHAKLISEKLSIPIIEYDLNGNKIKEWKSIIDAAKFYDIYPTTICNSLKNKSKIANKKLWRYKSENTGKKIEVSLCKGNKVRFKLKNLVTGEITIYNNFQSFNQKYHICSTTFYKYLKNGETYKNLQFLKIDSNEPITCYMHK